MANYREPARWNPPSSQTERAKMPDSAFLLITGSGDNKLRRYIVKMERPRGSGKYVYSRKGLMAARTRAAQHREIAVFNKTSRLLSRYFPREDEPYLTWEQHQRKKAGS